MARHPILGAIGLAASLAIGFAGIGHAAESADVQRYRQMLETYRADPLGADLASELATMNAWIETADGHIQRDQDEEAERLVEQLDAQVGLIEARLSLARATQAQRRAETELAATRNQVERVKRTLERLETHRARLVREEG